MRIKILKENKLLKEGTEGIYQQTGVVPGVLDIFFNHFTQYGDDYNETKVKEFIEGNFSQLIENLEDDDIPRTKQGRYASSLEKVQALLKFGYTYWWFMLAPQMGNEDLWKYIIDYKVILYYQDLEEELNDIDYKGMMSLPKDLREEAFNKLTKEQKNIVYEKHFWEDYLISFFDQHVSQQLSGSKEFSGAIEGVTSGLYGQMTDWWMSNSEEGFEYFKAAMLREAERLKKKMSSNTNDEDSKDDKIGTKKPEYFPKDAKDTSPGAGFKTEKEAEKDYISRNTSRA